MVSATAPADRRRRLLPVGLDRETIAAGVVILALVVGGLWWVDHLRSRDQVSTAGLTWPVSTGPDWPLDVQRQADSVVLPTSVDATDADVADIATAVELASILDLSLSQLPPELQTLTAEEVQARESQLAAVQRDRFGPLVDAVFTGSAHASRREALAGDPVSLADYSVHVGTVGVSTLEIDGEQAQVTGTVSTTSSATVGVESALSPDGVFTNSTFTPFTADLHRDGAGHWRVDGWTVRPG